MILSDEFQKEIKGVLIFKKEILSEQTDTECEYLTELSYIILYRTEILVDVNLVLAIYRYYYFTKHLKVNILCSYVSYIWVIISYLSYKHTYLVQHNPHSSKVYHNEHYRGYLLNPKSIQLHRHIWKKKLLTCCLHYTGKRQ